MTLKNRVDQATLYNTAGNPAERDAVLLGAFSDRGMGLTKKRLEEVRFYSGSLYERAQFAAQALFQSLVELRVAPSEITAQFTVDNLAAIVNQEWTTPTNSTEILREAIRAMHEQDLQLKKNVFSFEDLSHPQLFRETIYHEGKPLYTGNLYQARRFWRKFQPSNEDFLTNLTLPIKIDYSEGVLLGIYWADGYLTRDKNCLIISGEQQDLDIERGINMYGDLVAHLLKKVHNYGPISGDSYIKERTTRQGVAHRPFFVINSNAVYTWLRDDLGYQYTPRGKHVSKRIPFDILLGLNAKKGFFAGLIAGLGKFNEYGELYFEHQSEEFIRDIAELSTRIGYSPSEVESRNTKKLGRGLRKNPLWHFTISRRDISRMLKTDLDIALPHAGLLINPRHYQSVIIPPTTII
ncbi:hypothetical protein HY637_01790 [Candidatus Woesearchaeota archaeon]|nr:hypothetical protein [Candidatus Pacearchaeota archaeon]MBI4452137.1 hypothetical protein [Candidatus Woesearchaeota archaeon]